MRNGRKQLNIWATEDFLAAITRIQHRLDPVPSKSDIIREAVLEKDERMAQEAERRERRRAAK